MRNFTAALVLAAALGLVAASSALADSSVPQAAGKSGVLVSLERTACYGTCPIYTVTVLGDGTVLWEGRRFVKVTGKAKAKLSEAKLTALEDAFKEADFFSLADTYVQYDMTDQPSAITQFDDGKRKKSIRHYHGDRRAPPALSELENKIDQIIGTVRWISRYR